MQFRTYKIFWASTDLSLVEYPKNLINTKATPPLLRLFVTPCCHSERNAVKRRISILFFFEILRFAQNDNFFPLDSAESQNLNKN